MARTPARIHIDVDTRPYIAAMTAAGRSTTMNLKNLGGEPVAIVGAIQAALVMAVSFGWLSAIGLSNQHDVALVVVVVSAAGAVYTAYITHHTLLAPVVALFQALVNLGVIYGLHITTEQTGMVVAFITAAFALFQRTQTSPLARGSFRLAA